MKKQLILAVAMSLIILTGSALSQDKPDPGISIIPQADAVTRHQIVIGGKPLAYTATCGTLPIRDEKEKTTARIFYISYTKDGIADRHDRPLLIAFNGGPGSSSVWLHMGFLGPRRVVYPDEGFLPKPPFRLVDNEFSILDEADLVFIDPVATGYSRMEPGEDPHKYHGVQEDLQAVAEFIRLYVTRNQRWASPKFLIGESYGTTRAAGLAGVLQNQHRMYLNGVTLVSSMTLGVEPGDDLSLALVLPHYTASAWYHNKLPADLQNKPLTETLKEAEAFALGAFLQALVKGGAIPAGERSAVARQMSRVTGIDAETLERMNLRIDRIGFRRELLKREKLLVGRLDSRYTAAANEATPFSVFDSDPAMNAWNGPFTAMVNQYFHQDLQYKSDRNYAIFGDVRPWKGMAESNVGLLLRQAMIQNPFLKVQVLAGYYDGATDYLSTRWAIGHIDAGGELKDRFRFDHYECGHMMYVRKADLAKAKKDLAAFIASAR